MSHPEGKFYGDFAPQSNERLPADYVDFLGVSIDELAGKTVLNIGSGRTGEFEKEAVENGATVFAMTPYFADEGPGGREIRRAYSDQTIAEKAKKLFGYRVAKDNLHPIAGRVEDGLPVAPGSMDYIFALYSVPLYLERSENIAAEISSTLKIGGKAVFYPIPESKRDAFIELFAPYALQASAVPIDEKSSDSVYKDEQSYRVEFQKQPQTEKRSIAED